LLGCRQHRRGDVLVAGGHTAVAREPGVSRISGVPRIPGVPRISPKWETLLPEEAVPRRDRPQVLAVGVHRIIVAPREPPDPSTVGVPDEPVVRRSTKGDPLARAVVKVVSHASAPLTSS